MTSRVVPLLPIVAMAILWSWVVYNRHRGRLWSPLWMAFSTTTLAVVFVTAGLSGYELRHGVPFTRPSSAAGMVIWSQVWTGATVAIVALVFWYVGLRTLRRQHSWTAAQNPRTPSRRPAPVIQSDRS